MTQEFFLYFKFAREKYRSDLKIIQFERQILYFNRSLFQKTYNSLEFLSFLYHTLIKHVSIQ